MKREHAHNPRRQYRRQCEAEGLVTKSGRQWRKFRKMMQRLAKEELSPETLKNLKAGIEDLKAGRYTLADPVLEETLTELDKIIETPSDEVMFPVLEHPDLDSINDGLVHLEPGDDPTIL